MKLKSDSDVLVVGAGPVGLFATLVLTENGLTTQVIDKELHGTTRSYAAALHPGSLSLLDRYGLLQELHEHGHRVERIAIHDGGQRVATMDLSELNVAFPYVLVVPQNALEAVLQRRLQSNNVDIFWKHQAIGLEFGSDGVTARVGRMEKVSKGYPIARTDWMIAKEFEVKSRFVVGADGYHSFVRRRLGVDFRETGLTETFAVFEFSGEIDSPHEARVVFHGGTVSAFWPLGAGVGRWSFQVDAEAPADLSLKALRELTDLRAPGFGIRVDELRWTDRVSFERLLVNRFGNGRVWLAGDAAHVTGPVGAQSMNVGLREARDLASLITAVQSNGNALETVDKYESDRMAEWTQLLGEQGMPQPVGHGPEGLAGRGARMLSCIPATGESMRDLLGQIGFRLDQ